MMEDFSKLLILLLKGVLYEESDPVLWGRLLHLQPRVREHFAVMGLSLEVDEAEGYAYLRSVRAEDDEASPVPRLIARRPLSFPVSLLIVLLRKKLLEFDASGGSTRLVVSRDEAVEMMRVFFPDQTNEARLFDQVGTHLNKVVELGFLKPLKGSDSFEVRRIIKAFVDAQWLASFDDCLKGYLEHATHE